MRLDECKGMYCNGKVKKQMNLQGEKTWICQNCGKEYDENGVLVNK